jgi:hypothetical protein
LEVFVFDVVCVVGDKRDDDNNLFNGWEERDNDKPLDRTW